MDGLAQALAQAVDEWLRENRAEICVIGALVVAGIAALVWSYL